MFTLFLMLLSSPTSPSPASKNPTRSRSDFSKKESESLEREMQAILDELNQAHPPILKAQEAGIANIEQGRTSPAWDTVLAIAAALGVDCSAFQEAPEPVKPARRGRPRKK